MRMISLILVALAILEPSFSEGKLESIKNAYLWAVEVSYMSMDSKNTSVPPTSISKEKLEN